LSHIPGSWLQGWLPGRFGFSDAADLFVFCSGFVSATAYGLIFERDFVAGTAKVIRRLFQVYLAHIVLFFVTISMFIFFNNLGFNILFAQRTYTDLIVRYPLDVIFGVITLTYQPKYFDILPLYVVLLAFIPLFSALRRAGKSVPIIVSLALWVASQAGLNLPGDRLGAHEWYFNPFAYQLIFFVGWAFALGWLERPKLTRFRLASAVVFLSVCVPLCLPRLRLEFPELERARETLMPLIDKTDLGILRLVYFLAAAYVTLALVDIFKRRYRTLTVANIAVSLLRRLGSHSLGVFVLGLFLSQLFGVFIALIEPTHVKVAILNVVGLCCYLLISRALIWILSAPWTRSGSWKKLQSNILDLGSSDFGGSREAPKQVQARQPFAAR
jgi:hypothetical protein